MASLKTPVTTDEKQRRVLLMFDGQTHILYKENTRKNAHQNT